MLVNISKMLCSALDMSPEEIKIQLESIKLSLKSLNGSKVNTREIVENSLDWMLLRYEETKDELYLNGGILQILAWLDMGLPYSNNQEIFNRVLARKGIGKELLLQNTETTGNRYRLSKNRIKTLIGRWRRGMETDLKFEVVIDDIYDRMEKGTIGQRAYYSHHSNGELFSAFEVIVTKDQNVLRDALRGKYYYFEVK